MINTYPLFHLALASWLHDETCAGLMFVCCRQQTFYSLAFPEYAPFCILPSMVMIWNITLNAYLLNKIRQIYHRLEQCGTEVITIPPMSPSQVLPDEHLFILRYYLPNQK
ncbi:hypothetical protein GGS20DRAFT_543752 [Poronia punctata]|nr:hypothetical protein GGS20DRAFT_543752 [Poronia punctata]